MITLIAIALGLAALYCAGMWLLYGYHGLRGRLALTDGDQIERHTFHLGLCFILAAGFLGLLLR